MSVWLNVAEKPSVAKEVSNVLSNGRATTTHSLSRYNPVFDFRYNNQQMLFTSLSGHLMEDDFAASAKNWSSTPLMSLFTAPIVRSVKAEFEPIQANLRALAKKATDIVLWLDGDREGENIAFEVLEVVLKSNARLRVHRAHFSALTARDLQHAVTHLRQPDRALSEAVEARREMDLRIGAVFTRWQTLRLRDRFPSTPKLISFGPCQFPTLGFLVRKDWERAAFIAEDTFHCTLTYADHTAAKDVTQEDDDDLVDDYDEEDDMAQPQSTRTTAKSKKRARGEDHSNRKHAAAASVRKTSHTTTFTWDVGTLYDEDTAVILYEEMLENAESGLLFGLHGTNADLPAAAAASPPGIAQVTRVQHQPTHRHPPCPMSTVTMQQLASSHLRLSAEQCMTAAEALYQQGFLSYPRTETDEYTYTDDELLDLCALQAENVEPSVGVYATALVAQREERYKRPKSGGHNDKAHPPIHPTKPLPNSGGGDHPHRALYQLVVRHFLASCSKPAVAASTSVSIMYGGQSFHTSGYTVVERGYLDVYPYDNWRSTADVPNFAVGDQFTPSQVWLHRGTTAAPPPLTESALIALMDQYGIGTDATIATHIKTIVDREYATRSANGVLRPTRFGEALLAAYVACGLRELLHPEKRAQMELAMGDIARGAATKAGVLQAAVTLYKDFFLQLTSKLDVFDEELRARLLENAEEGGATNRMGLPALGANAQPSLAPTVVQTLQRSFSSCGRCQGRTELVRLADGILALTCAACIRRAGGGGGAAESASSYFYRLPSHSSTQVTPHDSAVCPLCRFQVLVVTNTERQTTYTLCPYCAHHPPHPPATAASGAGGGAADIENAVLLGFTSTDGGGGGGFRFRCMDCLESSCPLAKGRENLPVRTCPTCRVEPLRLRRLAQSWALSCRSRTCTYHAVLPGAAQVQVTHPPQRCEHCNATKLFFQFTLSNVLPGRDMEEIVCVFCDAGIRDYIVVRGGPATTGVTPSAGGGGGGGGGVLPDGAMGAAYVMPTVVATRGRGRGARGGRGGGGAARGGAGRGGVASSSAAVGAAAGAVKCECGAAAVRFVSKQQASAGRAFLSCGNNRACTFFQWVDS